MAAATTTCEEPLGAAMPPKPTPEDIETLGFVCKNLGHIAALMIDVACGRDPLGQRREAKRILGGLGIEFRHAEATRS